jgi:hypothetical protein
VVKCNVCDQEFANSEELKRHQEGSHPVADVEGKEPELEQPDLMDTPVMKEPEPAERRDR